MGDYISREAFLEHIQKDPLFPLVEKYGLSGVIESFPAADVVEAVRCRECCRYDPERNYCENTGCEWDPWEFCSDGERKDGADNAAD